MTTVLILLSLASVTVHATSIMSSASSQQRSTTGYIQAEMTSTSKMIPLQTAPPVRTSDTSLRYYLGAPLSFITLLFIVTSTVAVVLLILICKRHCKKKIHQSHQITTVSSESVDIGKNERYSTAPITNSFNESYNQRYVYCFIYTAWCVHF